MPCSFLFSFFFCVLVIYLCVIFRSTIVRNALFTCYITFFKNTKNNLNTEILKKKKNSALLLSKTVTCTHTGSNWAHQPISVPSGPSSVRFTFPLYRLINFLYLAYTLARFRITDFNTIERTTTCWRTGKIIWFFF